LPSLRHGARQDERIGDAPIEGKLKKLGMREQALQERQPWILGFPDSLVSFRFLGFEERDRCHQHRKYHGSCRGPIMAGMKVREVKSPQHERIGKQA
jgi:hypothetical protein